MTPSRERLPIRRLTPADLPRVLALQSAVTAELPPGYVWPKSEDELLAFLRGERGAAFGIGTRAALLAISLLRLPDRERPNGNPRFRLVPSEDWPVGTAFLENAMVRPRARGRGFQRALIDVRLAHAASLGLRWICGGVRLGNRASWANLLASGLVIADMRFDLGEPMLGVLGALGGAELAREPGDLRRVDAQDAVGHRQALDDGYVGVRLAPDRSVVYQRLRRVSERAA